MNLHQLIKSLESAAELATGGDASTTAHPVGDDAMLTFGSGIVALAMKNNDAQAIAIRHNTAGEVIRRLKDERRHRDKMWDERDRWRARAEASSDELKAQRARADRLHELFLRVSEAAGLELFESPSVVLGEVKSLRARTDEARAIINELAFCIDPNAIGDAATEAFERAVEFLTKDPTS